MHVHPARSRAGLAVICVVVSLSFLPWARGQNTGDMLAQARDLVQQASGQAGNKPSDAERIQLLTQAIQLARQAPQHNLKGHRVLAIQNLRVAVTLLRDGDPQGKLPGYIKDATSELSAALALAEENDAAQLPDASAPAPAAAPPAVAPGIEPATPAAPAPPPAAAEANALPPGVTAAMEQDFLARYEAAMKTAETAKDEQGAAPYFALYAMDPAVDAKGKDAFQSMAMFGLALGATDQKATYTFLPVPPGDAAKNEVPTQLADKMYVGYLPEVAELKITYASPDHPSDHPVMDGSTEPLCLQNGRLMLIGIKEVPGAVPPPMDNPADNFGLTPNHIKPSDTDDGNDFASLGKFLASLKQPAVDVLDSGQNDYVYYAICRVKPDLFVYVQGSRPGKDNYDYTFQVTDANHTLITADKKSITLVEGPPGIDGKPIPILQGDVYHLVTGYSGPINFLGQYGNMADTTTPKLGLFKTVNWK